MNIPVRYNPVPVSYRRLLIGTTPRDPHFSEPRDGGQKKYSAVIATTAQVNYQKTDAEEHTLTGNPGVTSGQLVKKRAEAVAEGIAFGIGDVITEIAGQTVIYEVDEVRPTGHLRGASNLILIRFHQNQEVNASLRR